MAFYERRWIFGEVMCYVVSAIQVDTFPGYYNEGTDDTKKMIFDGLSGDSVDEEWRVVS